MEHITIREHQIPVVKNVDVFIAGGGPAGVGAAIQAARSGADVLLAERLFCLGGTMTAGLMSKVAMSACNYGLAHEIITRMDAYQGTHYLDSRPEVPVDPETGKIILEQMVIDEEHVDVRYGTVVSGVVTNGREIEAVVLSNLDGEIAVRAKYYIDCTGDGQMAFLAGAECMTEQGESYSSSPTLMFRIGNVDLEKMFRYEEENPELFVREYNTYKRHLMTGTECRENIRNQIYAHMADFVRLIRLRCSEHRDEFSEEDEEILLRRGILFLSQPYPNHVLVNSTTNPAWRGDSNVELSASMAEMRKHCHLIHRFAKRFIPGFEESFLMDTTSMMGIRESRRIRGEYVLTQEDIESFMTTPSAATAAAWRSTAGRRTACCSGSSTGWRATISRSGRFTRRTLQTCSWRAAVFPLPTPRCLQPGTSPTAAHSGRPPAPPRRSFQGAGKRTYGTWISGMCRRSAGLISQRWTTRNT